LIRSRRRQALLRAAGSTATRRPSLVGSLDPSASPRQETRRSRVLNDPRGIRQNPRSVSFDLERLSLVSLNVLRRLPRSRPQGNTAKHRTRRSPTRERPKDVSCIALFTMSVRCRLARAIGQEGSSSDEPANQIVSRILRLCRKRRWWSLSRQRRANQ